MNSLSLLITIVIIFVMETQKVALGLFRKRVKLVPDLEKEPIELREMKSFRQNHVQEFGDKVKLVPDLEKKSYQFTEMENLGQDNVKQFPEYHSLSSNMFEIQQEVVRCKNLFLKLYDMYVQEYLRTLSGYCSFDFSEKVELDKGFLPKYPRLDCPLFITLKILHALDTVESCREVTVHMLTELSMSKNLDNVEPTLSFIRVHVVWLSEILELTRSIYLDLTNKWTERPKNTLKDKCFERVASINNKTKVYHVLMEVLLGANYLFVSLLYRLPTEQQEEEYLSWSNRQRYYMACSFNFVTLDIHVRLKKLNLEQFLEKTEKIAHELYQLDADFEGCNSNMGFISSTEIHSLTLDIYQAKMKSVLINFIEKPLLNGSFDMNQLRKQETSIFTLWMIGGVYLTHIWLIYMTLIDYSLSIYEFQSYQTCYPDDANCCLAFLNSLEYFNVQIAILKKHFYLEEQHYYRFKKSKLNVGKTINSHLYRTKELYEKTILDMRNIQGLGLKMSRLGTDFVKILDPKVLFDGKEILENMNKYATLLAMDVKDSFVVYWS